MTKALQRGVGIIAIMNPASGPGDAPSADYTIAIAAFRAAGGRVLGYVPTGYLGTSVNSTSSCRPAAGMRYSEADIVGCASRYGAYYVIDGIFLDEFGPPAGGSPPEAVVAYYERIYDRLKLVNPNWEIVGNPGTVGLSGLLRRGAKGAADRLVTFENDGARHGGPSAAAVPAAWMLHEGRSRFIHILHSVPAGTDLDDLVAAVAAAHAGGVFITDGGMPNPYGALPKDFDGLVAAVQRFNARNAGKP